MLIYKCFGRSSVSIATNIYSQHLLFYMNGIIAILGSPNDDGGNLSDIAVGRNKKGMEEYRNREGYKILVTGGFGNHFNTTDKPHAYYAKQFLIKEGVLEEDILEFAESHDTVEDALLAKPIIDKYGVKDLVIVSSDFHMERVRYIFQKVFEGYDLRFSAAKTDFDDEKNRMLQAHEKKEIEKLQRKGINGNIW